MSSLKEIIKAYPVIGVGGTSRGEKEEDMGIIIHAIPPNGSEENKILVWVDRKNAIHFAANVLDAIVNLGWVKDTPQDLIDLDERFSVWNRVVKSLTSEK